MLVVNKMYVNNRKQIINAFVGRMQIVCCSRSVWCDTNLEQLNNIITRTFRFLNDCGAAA
jgi:hypothetical protein